MTLKDGKFGKYLQCAKPECNTKMQEGDVFHDERCPSCNSLVLLKTGRYGKYLKCSKCTFTKSINELSGTCPICHKPAQKMMSKKGTVYYG